MKKQNKLIKIKKKKKNKFKNKLKILFKKMQLKFYNVKIKNPLNFKKK